MTQSTSRWLARAASPVGWGVAALGLGSFLYLSVAGRALGPEAFAPLAVFWTLLNMLGIGLFLPVEQETGRVLAGRAATAVGTRGPALRAAVLTSALTAVALLLLGAFCPVVADDALGGSRALVAVLAAGMVASALSYWARGVMAGVGAWRSYGSQLAVDAALRVLGPLVLAAAGVATATPFAWVLVAAVLLGTVLTVRRPLDLLTPGPPQPWAELTASLGWLLLGSAAGLALLNGAPLAVQLLGQEHDPAAGTFLAALVVVRVPLFLFAAVQITLLPRLTGLAERGEAAALRAALRSLVLAVTAGGAVLTAASLVLGGRALHLVFGQAYRMNGSVLGVLMATTAGFMLLGVTTQALIALRQQPRAAAAQAIGLSVFVLTCATLRTDVPVRVATGLLVAVLSAVAVTCASLIRVLPREARVAV